MAKRKPKDLPEADRMVTLTVEIPELLEIPEEVYVSRHVEGVLNHAEAVTLKRLLHTLEFGGVQLEDGQYVKRPTHAVRWLLEQVGKAVA